MAELLIPQKDNSGNRKKELEKEAKTYSYNYDAVIPLIQAEGERDKVGPLWAVQIIRILLQIRANMGDIVKKSGWRFTKELEKRDPRTLVAMLAKGVNPIKYYGPDLGAILPSGRTQNIDDYKSKIFIRDKAPDIANRWDSDEQFAYTFLAGPNPNQVQRLKSILPNFPISNTHFQSVPELASDDLSQAMNEGRVFYVDHTGMQVLKNGVHPQGPKYMYAPLAAFAVAKGGNRMHPFAIQCGPTPEGREIYTPKDGYSWKIARNCVLAAHNNHHEVVSHLGLTHLLIDPVVAATRRCLHPNHPVYQLLHPHFEGTVAINVSARTFLIQPGESVDRLVGSEIFDNHKLLGAERLKFSWRSNYLPTRLKRFEVDNGATLPIYPYRDDAVLVWQAIHDWVAAYVDHFYESDAEIRGDFELQSWAKEASTVGKIKDFGVTPGGVRDRADLIDIATMTIFTAGPQHAAVNFCQGTDMTFTPANPLAGYTPEPKGKSHTKKDWMDNFPPLDVAVHAYSMLTLLAGINHSRLGYAYSVDVYKTPINAAMDKFQAKLKEIEGIIQSRNRSRVPYVHLLPSRIPASINI